LCSSRGGSMRSGSKRVGSLQNSGRRLTCRAEKARNSPPGWWLEEGVWGLLWA
jgi:hypothetical protein